MTPAIVREVNDCGTPTERPARFKADPVEPIAKTARSLSKLRHGVA